MMSRKVESSTRVKMLGMIERLSSEMLSRSSDFSRMVIGLFQTQHGRLSHEDKLGVMVVTLERARKSFLAEVLTVEEVALFVGWCEEIFIIKPRSVSWGKIGKYALIAAVLYGAYKLYAWVKTPVTDAVKKLGDDIKEGSKTLKDAAGDVTAEPYERLKKDLKDFSENVLPEEVKKHVESVKEEVNDVVKNASEQLGKKLNEAIENIDERRKSAVSAENIWGGIGSFAAYPFRSFRDKIVSACRAAKDGYNRGFDPYSDFDPHG